MLSLVSYKKKKYYGISCVKQIFNLLSQKITNKIIVIINKTSSNTFLPVVGKLFLKNSPKKLFILSNIVLVGLLIISIYLLFFYLMLFIAISTLTAAKLDCASNFFKEQSVFD